MEIHQETDAGPSGPLAAQCSIDQQWTAGLALPGLPNESVNWMIELKGLAGPSLKRVNNVS